MPIHEYAAEDPSKGCSYCRDGFDHLQQLNDPPLKYCPKCGTTLAKQFSAPRVGSSKTGLDDRAKSAGFHKLKKLGSGEYEKQY